eukprot:159496_1
MASKPFRENRTFQNFPFHHHRVSDPFGDAKKMNQIKQEQLNKMHRSAFPEKRTTSDYLWISTKTHSQWRKRYFVLNNNYLLCGDSPYAQLLAACIPLEGAKCSKASEMTFEVTTNHKRSRKQKRSRKSKTKTYYFRAQSSNGCAQWMHHIERASTLRIKDIYRLRYKLGNNESQSATVIAARHRISHRDFAIKIMDKRTCNSQQKQMLYREIKILKHLHHEYIVELCDLFETRKYLYLVMEYCRGGELFDKIASLDGDHYSEVDCCQIMHQLASGVGYMHRQGIVHRDIKPENILCVEDSIKKVKIADFGISRIIGRNMMNTRVGTLSYTAPEIVLDQQYDYRVDYWSLGVIMFILLCGYHPFDGETDFDVMESIIHDGVVFDDEDWKHVSGDTQALVARLLCKNPEARATCNDIIKNVWKVEVNHISFKKAQHKLKLTVLKRKLGGRISYDENYMRLHNNERINNSPEPMDNEQYDEFAQDKKCENSFLEHIHPMNYRDSFVLNTVKEVDGNN